jgi:transcriptional regulator with XRE-family HTH domain
MSGALPSPVQLRPFAVRREELGLSLHRAAARLRVSPRYLRTLELGRAPLSLVLAQRMALQYGCPVDRLTRPSE